MATVKATSIKERDEVRNVQKGDTVVFNNFKVEVDEVVCAMGGDMCISGTVKSWRHEHAYNLTYGQKVFWGPKGMSNDLYAYLNGKFIGIKS